MIITRAPLRISIGGGGTDMPSYYEGVGTIFSSLAIDKYVTIIIAKRFSDKFFIRYMENEEVSCLGSLKHDIFRTVLGRYNFQDPVEVASFADIPSGTGLGSSGSFTVALCAALKSYFDIPLDKHVIASEATQIEMNELGRPVGLQDQYAASFGDFHEYRVSSSGKVKESRIVLDDRAQSFVENNLLLFFTNGLRDSSKILFNEQKLMKDKEKLKSSFQYNKIIEMGIMMTKYLKDGEVEKFGNILNEYWQMKRNRQAIYTDNKVDEIYNLAMQNGAIGGKLVGAGGSGFLLFVTNKPKKLRHAMNNAGIKELVFNIAKKGVEVVQH